MSREARAELEAAQARLRELGQRADGVHALRPLAQGLRREADALEGVLARVERRSLSREAAGPAARLLAFGFAVLFVLPIVAMAGFTAGAALRHEPLAASASLGAGVALMAVSMSRRGRGAVRRWVSPDWRLSRQAKHLAERLERL